MGTKFSVYQPNAESYIGFGITEGLRKHMEYMQQQKMEAERAQQFQQELAFKRHSAETEAIQRADELAQREQAFNKSAASDAARLDFEKEKFKQDKKQWAMEYPTRMEYLRNTAGARETSAAAAKTKANAIAQGKTGAGKGVYTPQGLGKLYADTYTKNFNEIAKTYSSDFTNIYSDKELFDKVDQQANDKTRKALTPSLNMYNDYVGSNPTAVGMPQMSFDDLEAIPSVQEGKKKTDAGTKIGKGWNAVQNDKTFSSRFESLDITDNELDLLRINAPDLYQIYVNKIKEKGSDKLKNKIAADAAEKARQKMVEKNADKR